MLVGLREMLEKARKEKYAVPFFNMLNLETLRGIIMAAEAENSPVILGIAEVHFPIIPLEYGAYLMMKAAKDAKVPVCLHLDHATDERFIKEVLEKGFTSVMFDGSTLEFEENIRRTKEVVQTAKKHGANVEAELGHVGGGGDGAQGIEDQIYTDPLQVARYVQETGIDALAVAIGTVHGKLKTYPKLNLELLSQINKVSEVPLVLHGGSGLTEDDFKATIKHGISKINICTDLLIAAANVCKNGDIYENIVADSVLAVEKAARIKIRTFGSSGKVC